METFHIAPCGMNCSICMAFLRTKNKCTGCRGSVEGKAKTVISCKIKNCEQLNSDYCFTCIDYPCKRIKHIDKRYRSKYHMSMVENLQNIQSIGIAQFVINERKRWACPICGGTICVHKGQCMSCSKKLLSESMGLNNKSKI
jgi:hypothetical protein